ncbi:hypothetical protein DAPPUDRAFT_333147 [Daphnia pulex]|uniref:Uncharacterized protein n=1 Tax=Daphnia pulex TaxID=6669 RepID=E9HS07_DAPPU|nr:hypothetical protein DAPPUDRAFT_333147 [Daphnia pulex]|eukprot:EFX65479.1 hypothetical protein DAPPUDRAFT_333147 [Daphnia pulex]
MGCATWVTPAQYEAPPVFKTPQTQKWFLAAYVRDVWSRLETLKGSATSIYGSILKIDSTKKITIKLQGTSANSVSWCTNVGLFSASTNESHPLYGIFMSRISTAIFEWDSSDVALLKEAKCGELKLAGIRQQSQETVLKSITKQELARHCRRMTRGVENTTNLLEELFSSLMDVTDTLGVPILRENAFEILETEIKHIQCLQDPTGVLLYTKTISIEKGGISLPVYRCARGTTSLENFHSHIKNCIPGTSANDVHFSSVSSRRNHKMEHGKKIGFA